jgi:hypothetical protein
MFIFNISIIGLLKTHRINSLQTAEGENAVMMNAEMTPNSLLRRYEVSIIPPAEEKTKKLREVKANGKLF